MTPAPTVSVIHLTGVLFAALPVDPLPAARRFVELLLTAVD
jgi:hypothetical protein